MSTSLLMIEDDLRLAQMVGEYLAQSGMQLTHCPDATSGLARLQGQEGGALPELVILDLMLPDMDGLEVCRRIRALPGP
ncbi:MAG: response regulator, partial [Giesbergeria sp.]